jgi:hypothetical protein
MLEAECSKCGETFNPADEEDLEHLVTEAGVECGGAGTITGSWSPGRRVAVALEVLVPDGTPDAGVALAIDSVLEARLAGFYVRRIAVHPDVDVLFPPADEVGHGGN